MTASDYNYLNNLLDKVAKEQSLFASLLGDFKLNLLHYNNYNTTSEFLDLLGSKSVLPYILQPTRIICHSKLPITSSDKM